MSYGAQFGGRASPSYPPSQLPGGHGYPQGPYAPTPQQAHQQHAPQGYPQSYSPQPGMAPSLNRSYSPQPGMGPSMHRSYSPQPGMGPSMHHQPPSATQQQMHRSYSPQPGMGPSMHHQPPSAAQQQQQPQIQPGAITYTTVAGPDGRLVYHCFKAVPASYQTPSGVVTGIQWIPAEATNILPDGAQPAGADFAASWNRGNLSDDDKKAIEKWQREEEKRRRKDEKEAAKRVHEWERDRRERDKAEEREERELRKARERDGSGNPNERRRSGIYSTAGSAVGSIPGGYPTSATGGYERESIYSAGGSSDIARGLANMGIGGTGSGVGTYGHDRKSSGGFAIPRSRRASMNAGMMESAAAMGIAGSHHSDRSPHGSQVGAYGAPVGYAGSGAAYGGAAPGRSLSRAGSPYMANRSPLPSRSPLPAETILPRGPSPYNVGYGANEAGRRTADPYARPVSPYIVSATGTQGSDGVYPRGHVLEGQMMPRSPLPGQPNNLYGGVQPGHTASVGMPSIVGYAGSASRPPSRVGAGPGAGQVVYGSTPGQPNHNAQSQHGYEASVGMPDPTTAAMTPPEGFTRRPNRSQPYTPFEPVKIQDLDDFVDHMPRMPLALVPHDVLHPDWIRFMTDIGLAWSGRLPVPPGSRLPRPSSAVADLIEMWNAHFFNARSVEVVLYKGRERRTGPDAGMVDNLPLINQGDMTSSSSSESEESESEEENYGGSGYDRREARRARRVERKAEKKRRRKEKKARRKAREMEKRYSVFVTYQPPAHAVGRGPSMY